MNINKKAAYLLMILLVILWGLDFIAAKLALNSFDPLTLVFLKYTLALVIVYIIKRYKEPAVSLQKKDLLLFFLCALIGEISYFGFEYSSMSFLALSVISIILSAVPVVTMVAEAVFFKRPVNLTMFLGACLSVVGVSFIIGADFKELLNGKIIGYLFALGAVICWTVYNFITEALHKTYSSVSISFYQILLAVIILAPYALTHFPTIQTINTNTFLWILYMGVGSTGCGYIIYVIAINKIGVTPSSLFSNFLPLSTTLLAWIILGESISLLQIFGGILTLAAACIVILEKDKLAKATASKKVCVNE